MCSGGRPDAALCFVRELCIYLAPGENLRTNVTDPKGVGAIPARWMLSRWKWKASVCFIFMLFYLVQSSIEQAGGQEEKVHSHVVVMDTYQLASIGHTQTNVTYVHIYKEQVTARALI